MTFKPGMSIIDSPKNHDPFSYQLQSSFDARQGAGIKQKSFWAPILKSEIKERSRFIDYQEFQMIVTIEFCLVNV